MTNLYETETVQKATTATLVAAIQVAGGQQKLAEYLGVTQAAISKWKVTGKIPPARWQSLINFALGGDLL